MEKFKDLQYRRPDVKQLKKDANRHIAAFKKAKTFEEAITDAVDAMKEKIVRIKEKKFDK